MDKLEYIKILFKHIYKLAILLAICSAISVSCLNMIYGQTEGDKIVAIVGNYIITSSELKERIEDYMLRNRISLLQYNPSIEQTVFNELYMTKLVLAKGDQDSVDASGDEVSKALDNRLRSEMEAYGSEKNVELAYGQPISKLRESWKEEAKEQIIFQKVWEKKFEGPVKVTPNEVENFYNNYKDSSIFIKPGTYELYQILLFPKPSDEIKRAAYEKVKSLLDSIHHGTNFKELAFKYSDDSLSRMYGGYFGVWAKKSFFKEYEDVASRMEPGNHYDIAETPIGYYIINLKSKSGDSLETSHIYAKYEITLSSDTECFNRLARIRTEALSGEKSFQEMAVQYSEDKYSAIDSGYIGRISTIALDSIRNAALKNLNPGDITEPCPIRVGSIEYNGYSIYLIKNKYPEGRFTLQNDYKLIEEYTQRLKYNDEIAQWIKELEKDIYHVDKRSGFY